LNFNIYNSLILIGAIQGLIFAGVVLFSKKYRSKSTFFLMLLILSVSLNNLQYYLQDTNIITAEQLFEILYIPYASINPPLFYLYIIAFLYPEKILTLNNKLLFIPFLGFLLITIIYKVLKLFIETSQSFQKVFQGLANFHELFSVIFTLVILIISFRKIISFEKNQNDYSSNNVKLKLSWLKATLAILFLGFCIYTFLMIKTIFNPSEFISFYALWIFNSFIIYWLGHVGIYKYGIIEERKKIRNLMPFAKIIPLLKNKKMNT
jgi:hypothetical protein